MIKLPWNTYITFLDEKWNVVSENVKVREIPRAHELVYLQADNKYHRVCNVVYNVSNKKCDNILVVIENYTDDYNLIEKNVKNNLTNQ